MTITLDQLKDALSEFPFCRDRNHRDERFGQYIYNQYGIEYKNSYHVESKFKAYQLLQEYITLTKSDVKHFGGKSNDREQ